MVDTKTANPADQVTIAKLKSLGFLDEPVETPRRLVCAIEGGWLTGKTHFSLTAVEPIIFFDVDIGTEGVVNKFQALGKKIFIYRVRVPKISTQDAYTVLWTETKARIQLAYSLSEGTVVWDTESEINELARLSHFGKLTQVQPFHYAQVNRELGDVLNWAYDSKMSSIFIRKMKPKWVNNARTNEMEGSGWGDMEYKCQVNLTMYREDGEGGPAFSILIKKCRSNPDITGTVLRQPMNTFPFLMNLVHGPLVK